MKLRVTVEVEINEAALDESYLPVSSKTNETRAVYASDAQDPMSIETRRMFAMDALDRYHGMPGRCVKHWRIVENKLVEE